MNEIILVNTRELIAHEKVRIRHALYLVFQMIVSGYFKKPLLIDSETKVVLDGHHRCYAAHRLGLKRVPCYSVNYLTNDSIRVYSWQTGLPVNKKEVMATALSPKVFPHKTTRHEYKVPDFQPIKLKELRKQKINL